MLPIFAWLVLILALAVIFNWWMKNEQFEKIPGPKGIFIAENALDFVMDPVKLFYYIRRLANTYKEIFKVKLGTKKFVIIHNPEDVEALISGTKYNSKGFLYGFIEPFLNEGLLLSDGPKWHNRRKILTPTFHFNILRHFHLVLEENSRKLVEKLEKETINARTAIANYITEFTLQSVCETAMGTRLNEDDCVVGKSYKNSIYELGQSIVYRAQRVWMYPDVLFPLTGVGKRQKEILSHLSSFRDNVIDRRRESEDYKNLLENVTNFNNDELVTGKKRLAMLDLLLRAEKDGIIDSKGIGEEVDTFMFEGHDTTSTALQFALMSLANNKDAQEKVYEECTQIAGSSDHQTTMNDLTQMKYLECCIKETLRLYPPVHFISRNICQPLVLKNHVVPPGTDCSVLIFDLHRRSDQFEEPQEFRPERFQTEKPTWHPYAYIPFSAGPRNCIGQKFAMIEMKLAISAIIRRYRLEPVTKAQDIIFVTDFILRSRDPIYVKIVKRT